MAQTEREAITLTLTSDVLNVLNASRGLTLSQEQLRAIAQGKISAPPPRMCVGSIGYDSGGRIVDVILNNLAGSYGYMLDGTNAENLSEFRDQFEAAAHYGHSVAVVVNSEAKRIEFLQIISCDCLCPERDRLGRSEPAEVRTR